MGFADRRYSRPDRSWQGGSSGPGDWTAVTTLVIANVAVWVACLLASDDIRPLRLLGDNGTLADLLALTSDPRRDLFQPWRFVTYGFAHSMTTFWHVLLNMIALWFFGPEVEERVGRAEFFRFWIAAIVVSGLAWLASSLVGGPGGRIGYLVGASGAVMATLAVFIWNNPHQELLLWGILPVPAWALGLLYFFSDVTGAYQHSGNVAHVAHIGGALFGLAYAWRGWDLGDLLEAPGRLLQSQSRFSVLRPDDAPRPRGRVFHEPDRESGTAPGGERHTASLDDDLRDAVDRILEKISRTGEGSLTPEERETLTQASRRLKERLR